MTVSEDSGVIGGVSVRNIKQIMTHQPSQVMTKKFLSQKITKILFSKTTRRNNNSLSPKFLKLLKN